MRAAAATVRLSSARLDAGSTRGDGGPTTACRRDRAWIDVGVVDGGGALATARVRPVANLDGLDDAVRLVTFEDAGVAEAMARRRREIERGDEAALAALHAAFRRVVEDELSRGLYASELRGLRGDGPSLHVARYAAPTLRRGEGYAAYFCRADRSEAGSRRRRGCDVEISWR